MQIAKTIVISLMALPVLISCTGEPSLVNDIAQKSKIVNTASEGMQDGILVCFNSEDEIPSGLKTERLFPSTPGKEEVEKKHGLDKWYIVDVPEGVDASLLATELEKEDCVRSIEFKTRLTRHYEKDDIDINSFDPVTKAGEPAKMNDPLSKSQWFLHNNGDKSTFGNTTVEGADIRARYAWELCSGDPSVIVAVVDEGVKYTHPDLEANMWVNEKEIPDNGIDDDGNGYIDDVHGYNFAADGIISWGLAGDEGHGTHVAGLVAAVNNNGTGISSIAGGSGKSDGVRIMSCQIFSGAARDNNAAVARAIKYAADNGASVLQCSFGLGSYYSDKAFSESLSSVKAAYDYFRDPANANCSAVDGNIVIISAGNSHNSKAEYPGAYRDFICVSATSQDNLPGWYTNYGAGVNIASPGGDNTLPITMLSTVPSETDKAHQDYGFMHGTSMATPVVSGIAALGLSYALQTGRSFTREEFEGMILSSVNPLEEYLVGSKATPSGSMDLARFRGGKMGTGVIDAYKLLMNISGTPYVTVKTGETENISLKYLFGDDAQTLTFTGVTVSDSARNNLGLESNPEVSAGILTINCSNSGCAVLEISAIAGGSTAGSETEMGGKEFRRKISIMSRPNPSGNGGWL